MFQGGEHGGVLISFFWVQASPGKGPRLHKHPYAEIFVILEGHATFTIGDDTIEVDGGHLVIGPAGVAHTFVNSGETTLRQITIHPSAQVITEWLEDEKSSTDGRDDPYVDESIMVYHDALEPKELHLYPGGAYGTLIFDSSNGPDLYARLIAFVRRSGQIAEKKG